MSIEFNCPTCQSLLGVAKESVGNWIRCPHCGNTTSVPKPGTPSPPAKPNPYSAPANPYEGNPYQSTPYGRTAPRDQRQTVIARTLPAAIVWLLVSMLNLIVPSIGLIGFTFTFLDSGWNGNDLVTLIYCLALCCISLMGILGAFFMIRLRCHSFCVVSAALTILGGFSCCFLPSATAIWVLVMLLLPGTREQFGILPAIR